MVKDIYGWESSDNYKKVIVKQFIRSTTEDMMAYIKPPLKCNADHFIIPVGTNDLRSDHDRETVVRNVAYIANNSKTDINKILISTIVPRRDNLNGNVRQVNLFKEILYGKRFCLCESCQY